MATMHFDKLVRDRIPEILQKSGVVVEARVLTTEEYAKALRTKLIEEASELDRALTTKDMQEEMADVLEVIEAIAAFSGFSLDDIRAVQKTKRDERGGFSKRIFLIAKHDSK
jgi:predicted house-cleaning noncanonical NTP pyrophosphatase (MazG superfamily)